MAKTKTQYVCQECGNSTLRWEGQCRACQAWNTLVEEKIIATKKDEGRGWSVTGDSGVTKLRLDQEPTAETMNRTSIGIQELDRVLGGGLVTGSFILLGGDPGIGKSTLLLQMAGLIAKQNMDVLYVSAEESVEQTALRARRLGIRSEKLTVAAESKLENILQLAKSTAPKLLIVDSIQTVYLSDMQSAPGTVSQVRECASHLMGLAKGNGIIVFVIGHVTKDGQIAGPRVLEHMVDSVLSFEGDNHHQFRLLRALKNRFGPTNELGVFRMAHGGLEEVSNPSEIFLADRNEGHVGSVVFAAMEGTRPLLCEMQALSDYTPLAFPRRTALGFDTNRLHLLVAILSKHLSCDFSKLDVYINTVGGLKVNEPAADLATAAALLSTYMQLEMPFDVAFAGELGLTGEVRGINFDEERLREAKKLGFKAICLPSQSQKNLSKMASAEFKVHFLKNVDDLKRFLQDHGKARGKKAVRKPADSGRETSALDL